MPMPDANADPPPAAHDAAATLAASHHHHHHPHPAHPAAPTAAAPLVADELQQHITVAPGQEFTLRKISSGSIGYRWDLVEAGAPQVVELVGTADSQDDPRPPSPPLAGAPSHTTWTFRAVAAGQTQLRFTFTQRIGLGMVVPGPEMYTVTVR
ncbi:MAG: protease inhibitor I42 family protein [Chloroflexota bacterium]|nr:protease inhibitor I42 family protein [Chloroflexota bacterium]